MPTLSITEAEILDALQTASTAPKDARTVAELQQVIGVKDVKKLRAALRTVAQEGRLTTYQVIRPGIDGRQARVPAYTIAPKTR